MSGLVDEDWGWGADASMGHLGMRFKDAPKISAGRIEFSWVLGSIL